MQVRIRLNPDGTLAAPPEVLNSGETSLFLASRDSAKRAVISGQPYDMFKSEHCQLWKEIEITFDPRDKAKRVASVPSSSKLPARQFLIAQQKIEAVERGYKDAKARPV